MNRNVKLSDASEEALIAELELRRIERKRAEVQKNIDGRSPEYFVRSKQTIRSHTVYHLDIIFTDGSRKNWQFKTSHGQTEEDRDKFLVTFFSPRLHEVSHKDFFKYNRRAK